MEAVAIQVVLLPTVWLAAIETEPPKQVMKVTLRPNKTLGIKLVLR